MFKKAIFASLGLITLFSGYAQAENGYYGGSFSFLDYSEAEIDDDASLTAVFGRLGTNFNENISGEIRLGFGVGDDNVNLDGFDVDVELDTMFGAYIRGGVPVTESFFPYVIFGYTRGEVSASIAGLGSTSETETDTSFGLGADVNVNQDITINIEYMNYFDKDGAEIDGFSIGLASKF